MFARESQQPAPGDEGASPAGGAAASAAIELVVADAKASARVKISHRVQARCLCSPPLAPSRAHHAENAAR